MRFLPICAILVLAVIGYSMFLGWLFSIFQSIELIQAHVISIGITSCQLCRALFNGPWDLRYHTSYFVLDLQQFRAPLYTSDKYCTWIRRYELGMLMQVTALFRVLT